MSIAILQAEIIAEQMEELIGGLPLDGKVNRMTQLRPMRWCVGLTASVGRLIDLGPNARFFETYGERSFTPHISDRNHNYHCYTFPEFMEFFREHS